MQLCRSFFFSDDATSMETAMICYKDQIEPKCDCLYMAVILGLVHLRHNKLYKEYTDAAEKAISQGKSVFPFQGVKISFKDDSTVIISEPSCSQPIMRALNSEGRHELGFIRPHLIQLVSWFDYKTPTIKAILNVAKLGLEALCDGYKFSKSQLAIDISQNVSVTKQTGDSSANSSTKNYFENNTSSLSAAASTTSSSCSSQAELTEKPVKTKVAEEEQTRVFKIQYAMPESDFLLRILRDDIAFLNAAIKVESVEQDDFFKQRLTEEKARFFQLHSFMLTGVAQTIDEFMRQRMCKLWEDNDVAAVVRLFESANSNKFSNYEAIEALIRRNPQTHQALKLEMRTLFEASLKDSTINVHAYSKGDESKKQ